MRKRNDILLAISTILMILVVITLSLYMVFLTERHHLLCNELKFGMSVDEVLAILDQHGEFTVNKAEWPGGMINLIINFTDPKGKLLYGSFHLGFSYYKYDLASTGGNIDFGPRAEPICYLDQITPPSIETPKP